jgi:hypothetical protein
VLTVHLARFFYTWTSVALSDPQHCLPVLHLRLACLYRTTRTLLLYILAPRRKDPSFIKPSSYPLLLHPSRLRAYLPSLTLPVVSHSNLVPSVLLPFLRPFRQDVLSSRRTVLGLQVPLLQARHRPMPRRWPARSPCAREDSPRRLRMQQPQQPPTRTRRRLGSAPRFWIRQRCIQHATMMDEHDDHAQSPCRLHALSTLEFC